MHTWFRQYAQQMGLQNTRALLPEQIDILINTSITDTINQLIRENIGVTNDRVITDNSKVGQINALKSLYRVEEIRCFNASSISTRATRTIIIKNGITGESIKAILLDIAEPITLSLLDINLNSSVENLNTAIDWNNENAEYRNYGIALEHITESDYIPFTETEDGKITLTLTTSHRIGLASDNGGYEAPIIELDTKSNFKFSSASINTGLIKGMSIVPDHLFLIDFSLNYINYKEGLNKGNTLNVVPTEADDEFISNYFPVRLIDDIYLADTLNDFILKPRLRSPIIVVYNDTYDLYIDRFKKTNVGYYLINNLIPYNLRVSYLAKPAKVRFAEDLMGNNVSCDLPEFMHIDILKHAVDLYRVSVSGALYTANQNTEAQQRENVRNNYRNEGN